MTSPPPVREVIQIIQDIGSRSRGSQSAESRKSRGHEYRDDVDNNEGPDSTVPQITNDDIIEAVRGQNKESDSKIEMGVDVGSKLDGFTSWIISGFDRLTTPGLRDPIRFLDWSGSGTIGHQEQRAHEGATNEVLDEYGHRKSTTISDRGGDSPENGDSQRKTENDDTLGRQGREDRSSVHAASQTAAGPTQIDVLQQKFYQLLGVGTTVVPHNDDGNELQKSPATRIAVVQSLTLDDKCTPTADQVEAIEVRREEKTTPLAGMVHSDRRDHISISSIEIPTPTKQFAKDDDYSGSMLGLEKGEKRLQTSIEQQGHQTQRAKQQKTSPGQKKKHEHRKETTSINPIKEKKTRRSHTRDKSKQKAGPAETKPSIVGKKLTHDKQASKE
jgi:hypothetical protein